VVSFFKIGWELFLATGLKYVKELTSQELNVFLDIKLPDDVDEQIRRTVALAALADVDFITIHGNGRTVQIAKQSKGDSKLKILSLTLLTSMDEFDLCDFYCIDFSQFRVDFPTLDDYVA
jgi:orotidine-5'-phosphate decarboxylase